MRRQTAAGRVIDGGAADIARVTGTMNSLRATADRQEFLLIADSKLASYRNITASIGAGTDFIPPAPASTVERRYGNFKGPLAVTSVSCRTT